MKNEALYRKTVDILVQAYFNNTLEHADCQACAVGNICLGNGAKQIMKEHYGGRPHSPLAWSNMSDGWASVFYTDTTQQYQTPENYIGLAKKVIDATGYTWNELAKIEFAFERAKAYGQKDPMFMRLMAVVETLDIIHENTDTEITQTSKKRFHKKNALAESFL